MSEEELAVIENEIDQGEETGQFDPDRVDETDQFDPGDETDQIDPVEETDQFDPDRLEETGQFDQGEETDQIDPIEETDQFDPDRVEETTDQLDPVEETDQLDPDKVEESDQLDPGEETDQFDPNLGEENNQFDPNLGDETDQFDPNLGEETDQFDPNLGEETDQFDPNLGEKSDQFDPNLGEETDQCDPDKIEESDQLDPGEETDQFDPNLGEETDQFDPNQDPETEVGAEPNPPDESDPSLLSMEETLLDLSNKVKELSSSVECQSQTYEKVLVEVELEKKRNEENTGRINKLEAASVLLEKEVSETKEKVILLEQRNAEGGSTQIEPVKMTYKVLIGCSGSVAAMKLPDLCHRLLSADCEIRVVVTDNAQHFFDNNALPSNVSVQTDRDEWTAWSARGDPVLHIELTKWAQLFLIAPLDANTLGKLAAGLCDNLLTCCSRAWDLKKPLLFCPAMNTRMYSHPSTAQHIGTLKAWGYHEVPVVAKMLICGDTGLGAMAEVDTIVQKVMQFLQGMSSSTA